LQFNQITEILQKSMNYDYERKLKYKQIVESTMDYTTSIYNYIILPKFRTAS